MSQKTCRHCDITFQRPDDCPIPADRCEECHFEIEAMKTPLCADGRPCGQQDHPDDDAYCHKCPHEGKVPEYEPTEVAFKAAGVRVDRQSGDRSKYHREIKPGVWVDCYDVIKAWGVTNPALQHLLKKALQPGGRGHKTLAQDLEDIIVSAKRAKELEQ